MPYCLACGKLRDLKGGLCWQCRNDMSLRKRNEARSDKAKVMRNIARDKRRDGYGKAKP